MIVNRQAMEEMGMSPDAEVTLAIINVSLRSALRLMHRKFEMTFVLKDEVLQITTIEDMRRTSIAKEFRIDDLPFAGADIATSLQRILDAKTLPGDAKPVVQFLAGRGGGAGLLLVDANDVALQEVESKLRWLRAKSQPNGR
jgi:hypothetical protein